jgi:LysR family hydrogen peroxide-inducible transcriptional activator
VIRFADPEPARTVGLVWRSTSPRKDDFRELGRLAVEAWQNGPLAMARQLHDVKKSGKDVSAETS